MISIKSAQHQLMYTVLPSYPVQSSITTTVLLHTLWMPLPTMPLPTMLPCVLCLYLRCQSVSHSKQPHIMAGLSCDAQAIAVQPVLLPVPCTL